MLPFKVDELINETFQFLQMSQFYNISCSEEEEEEGDDEEEEGEEEQGERPRILVGDEEEPHNEEVGSLV